jgi:nucleoside-diphosphate-sugar epimerase
MAVTGASGFVGGAVCRAAQAAGWSVVGFGRRPEAEIENGHLGGAGYKQWDLDAGPLLEPPDIDVVVHSGAMVAEWSDLKAARRTNIEGTRHVLESFPYARLVHISTASVYDPMVASVQVREDAEPAEHYVNAYAETKAAAERLLIGRPETVILRPRAVYGPGDSTLLPDLVRRVRLGLLPLPDGGAALQSMTSIENLVAAILLASDDEAPDGIYNIADGVPVTARDALAGILSGAGINAHIVGLPLGPLWLLADVTERVWRLLRLPATPPVSRYALSHVGMERTLDIEAARSKLGYVPKPASLGHPGPVVPEQSRPAAAEQVIRLDESRPPADVKR